MNEVLPRWRTFSSPGPQPAATGAAGTSDGARPSVSPGTPGVTSPAARPWPTGSPVLPRPTVAAGAPPPGLVPSAPMGSGPAGIGDGRVPLAAVVSAALGGLVAGSTLLLLGLTVLGVVDLGQPLGASVEAASQAAGWQAGDGLPSLGDLGVDPEADLTATRAVSAGAGGPGLLVDVAGAVARPGLQRVTAGARVADAIEAAGGYGPRVDLAAAARTLNLAQPLVDGSKVVVPELGLSDPAASQPGDERVDLNSADQAALESLPGIGPVTAAKIMAARGERPFAAVSELRDRGLVGESVYADIAELVRIGGS